MNARRLAVIAVVGWSLASLMAPQVSNAARADNEPVYHQSNSGGTVVMTQGAMFQVSLQAASDGGYEWVVMQRPNATVLAYNGSKNIANPEPPGYVGGGVRQVFTFTGINPGTTSFKLEEKRGFDPPQTQPIKRFMLTVHVR